MASSLSITTLIADEIFGVYEQFYRDAWVAFPEAAMTLSTLKQYRLATLTNGDLHQQMQDLRATGLANSFCGVFSSSEIGFAKPRAEAFLFACERSQGRSRKLRLCGR